MKRADFSNKTCQIKLNDFRFSTRSFRSEFINSKDSKDSETDIVTECRKSICCRQFRSRNSRNRQCYYHDNCRRRWQKKTSWHHEFIENNSQLKLIKTLYFDFEIRFSNVEYLKQRIILVIINVDVNIINNICVNRLFDSIINKFNSDRVVDSKMIKKNFEMFSSLRWSFTVVLYVSFENEHVYYVIS